MLWRLDVKTHFLLCQIELDELGVSCINFLRFHEHLHPHFGARRDLEFVINVGHEEEEFDI